jgi:hypothetical protein
VIVFWRSGISSFLGFDFSSSGDTLFLHVFFPPGFWAFRFLTRSQILEFSYLFHLYFQSGLFNFLFSSTCVWKWECWCFPQAGGIADRISSTPDVLISGVLGTRVRRCGSWRPECDGHYLIVQEFSESDVIRTLGPSGCGWNSVGVDGGPRGVMPMGSHRAGSL